MKSVEKWWKLPDITCGCGSADVTLSVKSEQPPGEGSCCGEQEPSFYAPKSIQLSRISRKSIATKSVGLKSLGGIAGIRNLDFYGDFDQPRVFSRKRPVRYATVDPEGTNDMAALHIG